MNSDKASYPKLDYDKYARTQPPEDFWRQVRRTVRGEPMPEEQIAMIVEAMRKNLALNPGDTLLDLACGNGALSRQIWDACAGYLGVDISDYLISVAKKHFESPPRIVFAVHDVLEYVRQESRPERFTKVLCYGSFAYFSAAAAEETLRLLYEKFGNVQRVFIGNLPDRDLSGEFYADRTPSREELDDHGAQIGVWRSREEFSALAGKAGWQAQFSVMPPGFCAVHYRYDALLSRPAGGK